MNHTNRRATSVMNDLLILHINPSWHSRAHKKQVDFSPIFEKLNYNKKNYTHEWIYLLICI